MVNFLRKSVEFDFAFP